MNFPSVWMHLVPESMHSTRDEIHKTVRAGVESMLQRLDVVTREEFDVQARLLTKTHERLNELQKRLDTLERGDNPEDPIS